MRRRTAARLAWSNLALTTALGLGNVAFSILNRSSPSGTGLSPVFDGLFFLGFLTFPAVGALVASRHPANPIGWIFCSVGLPLGLSGVAQGWAVYALFTDPGSLPVAGWAGWLASWLFLPPLIATGPLLFLLVPDGRFRSRSGRWLAGLTVAGIIATSLNAFAPGALDEPPFERIENPAGIRAVEPLLDPLAWFGWSALLVCIIASAASMLIRLRRARGDARQQLKWIAVASAVFALATLGASLTFDTRAEAAGQMAILLAFALIPVAAGYAILKHRLYDVDVVINRALVYGLLTASLAGAYFGTVVLLQLAFNPLTSDNALAVAGSTLAVAALFRPVRSRIQQGVDRRFYRRRYDAARTVEAFSTRLRDEIDLEALSGELRGVVRDAVQPAHVSLWLREAGR